ncbi:MAG: hypothetical protein ACE5FJ_04545 [Gemmatimonadales bacterium]
MLDRGRYWVALWLVFFLATLGWVVSRQTRSLVLAERTAALIHQHTALEALRAVQLRRVREAGSRTRVMRLAEEMGLRLPADSEIVILQIRGR